MPESKTEEVDMKRSNSLDEINPKLDIGKEIWGKV